MFERLLAFRYIKSQKRHSILTICSIAVALALMTMLFVGYSTFRGIRRDAAYLDKPYHFKLMQLTEAEFEQLSANPDFLSCVRVTEPDGSLSAEIMLGTYHDDFGMYINTLFPEKYIYSDLKETYKEDLIDVNFDLVEFDRLDFASKYYAVYYLAIFFIFVIFLVLTLRVMIDTAFEISSKERERQYAILQCAGAEPGQIVRIITFEGLFLCIAGIPLGILLGLGLSAAAFQAIRLSGIAEAFFTAEQIPEVMKLHISPLLLLLGAITGLFWVLFSAYGIGMRLIKKSPLQAITGGGTQVHKVRRFSLLGLLFDWKGRMAERNNRRQPKRFFITVASLTLSIMLFSTFGIALGNVLAAFEKAVDVLGLNYDLGVTISVEAGEPLSYKEGLEAIRDSGYFEIDHFTESQIAQIPYEEDQSILCVILYYPRETYDAQFVGEHVSYDDLTQQNAYLMMLQGGLNDSSISNYLREETQLDAVVQERVPVSEEAFQAMSAEEQAEVFEASYDDLITGEHVVMYRCTQNWLPATLPLAGTAIADGVDEQAGKFYGITHDASNMIILAGTLDMYENGACALAGDYGSQVNTEGVERIRLNLLDKDSYESAKAFINRNSSKLAIEEDFYGDLRKARSTVGAVQIGIAFLSVLIGLIAIVNMVNILSTSILNRKSELAAMQCIGMTQGQLYGMSAIESLQYALTAGVAATALIEALIGLMYLFLRSVELEEVFGELLNFTEPLPLVWIAAAVAFAAALLASFIPLRRMQRESLIDQIRTID